MHCDMVMQLCERGYGFDELGRPDDDRPASAERYRLVAGNPVACAIALAAFVQTYNEVFLGWRAGAEAQDNSRCLYGQVSSIGPFGFHPIRSHCSFRLQATCNTRAQLSCDKLEPSQHC